MAMSSASNIPRLKCSASRPPRVGCTRSRSVHSLTGVRVRRWLLRRPVRPLPVCFRTTREATGSYAAPSRGRPVGLCQSAHGNDLEQHFPRSLRKAATLTRKKTKFGRHRYFGGTYREEERRKGGGGMGQFLPGANSLLLPRANKFGVFPRRG